MTTTATPMDNEPIAVQASIQTRHIEVRLRRMRRQPDGTFIEMPLLPLSSFSEVQS